MAQVSRSRTSPTPAFLDRVHDWFPPGEREAHRLLAHPNRGRCGAPSPRSLRFSRATWTHRVAKRLFPLSEREAHRLLAHENRRCCGAPSPQKSTILTGDLDAQGRQAVVSAWRKGSTPSAGAPEQRALGAALYDSHGQPGRSGPPSGAKPSPLTTRLMHTSSDDRAPSHRPPDQNGPNPLRPLLKANGVTARRRTIWSAHPWHSGWTPSSSLHPT